MGQGLIHTFFLIDCFGPWWTWATSPFILVLQLHKASKRRIIARHLEFEGLRNQYLRGGWRVSSRNRSLSPEMVCTRDSTYNVQWLNFRHRNFKPSVLTTSIFWLWVKLISTAADPLRRRWQWQVLSSNWWGQFGHTTLTRPVNLSSDRTATIGPNVQETSVSCLTDNTFFV